MNAVQRLCARFNDAGVRRRLIEAMAEQSTYTGLQGVAVFVGLSSDRFAAIAGAMVFVFGIIKIALPDVRAQAR